MLDNNKQNFFFASKNNQKQQTNIKYNNKNLTESTASTSHLIKTNEANF